MSGTAVLPPAADDRQRIAPQEFFKRHLRLDLYDQARKQGMTLSQLLEREDPSDRHKDGTDAYQRMLMQAGIVTRSCPLGLYSASPVETFGETEQGRALFPEFILRQRRRIRSRHEPQKRAIYMADDTGVNTFLRPYADDPTPRPSDRTEPAIPLQEVVARTRMVGSDRARSLYLNRNAAQTRQKRVSEGAEIPRAKLTTGEHMQNLYKYGIALEATYEVLRRVAIDQFAFFIQMLEIQAETDKVAAAIDVMVNGDGNSGTAATSYNLTTLDSAAVAGTLTLKGWLAFKAKFANPYMLTHALAQEAIILQLLLLNVGSANVPLMERPDLGGFTPINQRFSDGTRWGLTADAPANKILGFDARFALGHLVETGSLIQEMDRWITKQTEVLTITENEGFETIDANAVKILVVNA